MLPPPMSTMAPSAPQHQLRFLVAGNDLHAQPAAPPYLLTEGAPIGRFAHGARRHRAELGHHEPVGDDFHLGKRHQGALHRLAGQPAARE
jgi:hypothetical protein